MDALREKINQKQAAVDTKLKEVEKARAENLERDLFNRKFSKANAALKAKLEFIEAKYDYTSSAKSMSLEDFKDLMNSNMSVNNTMDGFA